VARRYADAVEAFERITAPDHTHYAFLAACQVQLGNETAATDHARAVLTKKPDFSIDSYLATVHYKRDTDLEHHRQSLAKAGLPG
jgi:adenylate cyclase